MTKELLKIRKPNFNVIFIGFSIPLQLRIFGSLISAFEIISILFFIFELINNKEKEIDLYKDKFYQGVARLLILWSSSQLVSDVINKTSLKDSIKGIFVPILILLALRFILKIYRYFNYYNFIEDILIGFSLCFLFNVLSLNLDLEASLKLGGLFSISLIIYSLFENRSIQIISTIIILFISFIFGLRSNFMILSILVFNGFLYKKEFLTSFNLKIIPNILKGIYKYFLIILILLSLSPISNLINKIIITFYQNEDRIEVLENQSKGGLFSARTEYFSFFKAFKDSPLIGHGSWAIDETYKYSLLARRGNKANQIKTNRSIIKDINTIDIQLLDSTGYPYIPNHSFIQQSIIWGGFLSSFFFFYLFNLTLYCFSKINLPYSVSIILIKYIYDVFFTPLGLNRFYLPILCLITFQIIHKINKYRFENKDKSNN